MRGKIASQTKEELTSIFLLSLPASQYGNKTDILVNAAGMTQNSYLYRTDVADMQQILNVNLLGTTLGCQAFIPKMMRQKEGE